MIDWMNNFLTKFGKPPENKVFRVTRGGGKDNKFFFSLSLFLSLFVDGYTVVVKREEKDKTNDRKV